MNIIIAGTILPTTLTGYFIMAVAIFTAIIIVGRYIYYNIGGEKTAERLDNFYNDVRDMIFDIVDDFEPVIRAEKFGGRNAAKEEINLLIIQFIQDTPILRDSEKALILKFDLSFLVDEIEEELIKRGLLSAVPEQKNVDTSNPTEDSSG